MAKAKIFRAKDECKAERRGGGGEIVSHGALYALMT